MRKFLFMSMVIFAVLIYGETLVIKGSNTVYPIAQLWIEQFQKMYPNVTATLEGAGSSTGISALMNGTCDIANSSRFLKAGEIEQMHKNNKYFVPLVIAYDGIAVIVNPTLGIDSISIETLYKIYTGQITEWNQVDPKLPKRPIAAYSRNTASGTFEVWLEKVLKGEKLSPRIQMLESSQAEIESVSKNQYAIAYTGMGYVTNQVKALKVNGIEPTVENVLKGKYPLSRPLFVFFDLSRFNNMWPEDNAIADYIRFILSPEGQKLVEKAGYIPAYGTEK
ncbi:phosphate ABC transporter substrate-binding protein PstS family protein [Thermotoga profunda]|uniref:phosphate ABC transporter substrate-binding protein PstS family protein n=1 Tax=Thermotoga profunda TaxID=1508420 RepID=UPI000596EB9A|nr:phosphate ABC transporter substrate-binding protein PstS family protein [Thermotoga profunda]